MTYHYQRAANDHGNATKIMRCSKHYDIRNHPYNHRPHKMNRTIWFLHHILSCGMYKFSEKDGITFLYAHRHIALTMISLTAGNCSSTLSNTITGNHVHRNCILLCKLTVCTSLTVFLWMWLTRILVIRFQNLTGCMKLAISALVLTEIVIIVLLQHIILYGKLYFYF